MSSVPESSYFDCLGEEFRSFDGIEWERFWAVPPEGESSDVRDDPSLPLLGAEALGSAVSHAPPIPNDQLLAASADQ